MSFWKKLFGNSGGTDPQLGEVAKMMTIPQLDKALDELMSTGLDSARVLAGLGIECPNCGPYTKDAKTLVVICAKGGLIKPKGNFIPDPNMAVAAAAFARGQCPSCGAQEFRVTFSDKKA